jgi:hypothetical protein
MVKLGTVKESFELLLFDVMEFLAHLAKGNGSFCHHLQKQELPVAAMFVNRSGRNEQSL